MLRSFQAVQAVSGMKDYQNQGESMMDRAIITIAISGNGQYVRNIAMWTAVSTACRSAWP